MTEEQHEKIEDLLTSISIDEKLNILLRCFFTYDLRQGGLEHRDDIVAMILHVLEKSRGK